MGVLFVKLSVITVYKLTDVLLAVFAFVSSSTMHEMIKSIDQSDGKYDLCIPAA